MSYEKYYFKREPFLPDLDVKMLGREKEWDQIEAFLNESLAGNRIRSFLIIGDYGFGKTFTLNKIRESIEAPDSIIRNADKTLCVQIVLAETEPAGSISHEYVTKIFYSIGKEALFKISKRAPNADLAGLSRKFDMIANALINEKEEAFSWLIGETLSSSEKREIGVRRKFAPTESLSILMNFLRFLKICGYENLLVVLDEFEYAVNVYSEQKLTALFHTFKNIYDRFIERSAEYYAKHIQIIALTPKGYDVINDLEKRLRKKTGGGGISPWMERMRFERNQVSLRPLDDDSARELLIERIERERLKYKEVSYKTFPFVHPSFFDEMIKISKGKPRNLLDYSEIVLEEAARRDIKEIDGELVLKILEEYGGLIS